MKILITFLLQCLTGSIVFSQGLPLPYYTGFDSPSEIEGWQEFRTGFLSANSWSTGAGQLYHGYNVGGNSNDTVVDWFVSPPLNLTSPSTITMKVQTGGFSTPFPDNCEVWFGTGDPNPATGNFVLIANLSYMEPQYEWLDTSINLSFVSDNSYIAFKYKTIGAAWMTYGIDSVWVSSVAGINENVSKIGVNIFPNPFTESATVSIEGLSYISNNTTLTLYNVLGEEVHTIPVKSSTFEIQKESLEKGVYFYQVHNDNQVIANGKIVIQ